MFTTAILLAAGKGLRFRSRVSKLLIKLGSRTLVTYSLEALSRHPEIKEIIVVVNAANEKGVAAILKNHNYKKVIRVVEGGVRRQDSLGNALKFADSRSKLVLIHDAARPFINRKIISDAIKAARKSKASVSAVPVKATIKEGVGGVVKKTLNRDLLWEIQTPQVFKKNLILQAYKKFGKINVTDDAMLVEKLGSKVKVVLGTYKNIKITTPEDLAIARAIVRS